MQSSEDRCDLLELEGLLIGHLESVSTDIEYVFNMYS